MRPGKPVLVDGSQPGIFFTRLVERNTQYGKTFLIVFCKSLYQVWVFGAAGAAPARPEIDQYIFTPEGGELYQIAGGIGLFKIGRHLTDGGDFIWIYFIHDTPGEGGRFIVG